MNLNAIVHNHVRIRALDAQGRVLSEQSSQNTLTYAGADVMINALIRSGPATVTHLYARFGDSGSNPGDLQPADNDLNKTVRADFVASSDNIRGGLWVPILTVPLQESSNPDLYVGNRATFMFRIPANIAADQVSPAGNFAAGTSYIYALGLGVATAGSDRSRDLIISVLHDFNPFPVPPGGQIGIDYPFQWDIQPFTS